MELVGKTFGKFQAQKSLPHYGLGPAFEGIHLALGRPCVVKILPDAMRRDRTAVESFRTIASQVARLSHNHVPMVQEVIYEPPIVGYVIPFSPGATLAHRVSSQGRLPFPEFVRIFKSIIHALTALHKAGVVHRAVRPHSIILTSDGGVHLIDAGVQWDLRASQSAESIASAHYAAPDSSPDARSDFYSLGATMFYALTGRTPHLETTSAALLQAHQEKPPMPPSQFRPDLPASYNSLVLKLMERRPEARADLAYALSLIDPHSIAPAGKPVTRQPGPPPQRASNLIEPPPPAPKKTLYFAIGGAVAGLVILGLIIGLTGPSKPARPASQPPAPPKKVDVAVAAPTDESYYQDYLDAAKKLRTEGKLQEALEQAEQAQRFKKTDELATLISDVRQEIVFHQRTERAKPQYEKIVAMAAKKEDPVALCFECEEFLRANSDLACAAEIKTIFEAAKKEVEAKQAKGPITKLPPTEVKPRPGQPRPPTPRPPQPQPQQPPPPPPVSLGPEFDKAKGLVTEKKFGEAKPILIDMLKKETNANNRRAIGAEFYKCIMGDSSRWKAQFDGKDLDASFNVVRLSDSDITVAKDSSDIAGWARENDIAMLQFKNFKGGTGVTVECNIESKFQDPHSVAIRVDFQAGNAYKDFYLSERRGALKKVFKKEETELATVPAQGIFKRWIRLTLVVEGDTLYGFANDFLICALPTTEVKLGEDIRILIAGCSARLRDIQARF